MNNAMEDRFKVKAECVTICGGYGDLFPQEDCKECKDFATCVGFTCKCEAAVCHRCGEFLIEEEDIEDYLNMING